MNKIKKLICKIFGHNWTFPMDVMIARKRRIRPSDYKCNRCKITKDKIDNKLFLENILEK